MIIKGLQITHSLEEITDVCIVGSGAGGAILAKELGDQGYTVVLLEKGKYLPKEEQTQKEDEMIPALYKNSGLQFTIPTGIAVAQGSCLGGSTVINDAVCFRTPENVLQEWTQRYNIENISMDDMEQYFKRVEERISVSEVQPHEINKNNQMLKLGCERLEFESNPNKRNCKTCKQCGLCHLGCSYGTKQSMLETYIEDIVNNHESTTKIYVDCKANKILTSGNIVNEVRGEITGKDGEKFKIVVKPKILIVSGGAISSSELLLKSGLNKNGQVGKYLALHPSPAIIADFDEQINGHEGIPMAYHCSEFSILKNKDRGYLIESVFLSPYQFTLSLPGFQHEHKELMKRYNHYAVAGVLLQDESVGTISLGGPLDTMIQYQLSDGDAEMMIEGMKNTAKIFFAAGAKRIITSHKKKTILYSEDDLSIIDERGVGPLDINLGSGHPQGGNRMGSDEQSSVVNSYCKVHGFKNLFVVDASVFPTSVGVNPQLTVMAIATRVADHIAENFDKYRPS